MEVDMSNRTVKHEIKLQKSVIVILGILSVGVFLNAFVPAFSINDAIANFPGEIFLNHAGYINVNN
jgi:ribose 5-phosphate isomerase